MAAAHTEHVPGEQADADRTVTIDGRHVLGVLVIVVVVWWFVRRGRERSGAGASSD